MEKKSYYYYYKWRAVSQLLLKVSLNSIYIQNYSCICCGSNEEYLNQSQLYTNTRLLYTHFSEQCFQTNKYFSSSLPIYCHELSNPSSTHLYHQICFRCTIFVFYNFSILSTLFFLINLKIILLLTSVLDLIFSCSMSLVSRSHSSFFCVSSISCKYQTRDVTLTTLTSCTYRVVYHTTFLLCISFAQKEIKQVKCIVS